MAAQRNRRRFAAHAGLDPLNLRRLAWKAERNRCDLASMRQRGARPASSGADRADIDARRLLRRSREHGGSASCDERLSGLSAPARRGHSVSRRADRHNLVWANECPTNRAAAIFALFAPMAVYNGVRIKPAQQAATIDEKLTGP